MGGKDRLNAETVEGVRGSGEETQELVPVLALTLDKG